MLLLQEGQLLQKHSDKTNAYYLQAILNKYRRYASIEETAMKMFAQMGMRSTTFSDERPMVSGYSVPDVISIGYDQVKFWFTMSNGGKYEGKQVISPEAAKIVLRYKFR